MSNNYPPGNNTKAPWYYRADDFTKWEYCYNGDCKKCDKECVDLDENNVCEKCFEPELLERDYDRNEDVY